VSTTSDNYEISLADPDGHVIAKLIAYYDYAQKAWFIDDHRVTDSPLASRLDYVERRRRAGTRQ